MHAEPPSVGAPAAATARILSGAGEDSLGRWLARGDHLLGALRPLIGPLPGLVYDVGSESDALMPAIDAALQGLPSGPAAAEAAAIELRRAGVPLTVAAGNRVIRTRRELVRVFAAYGRDAVTVWRARPALLPELRLGSWFIAGWRARVLRRLALVTRLSPIFLPAPIAADTAFWAGVRRSARHNEWRRLTSSHYVVLCYHRVAGLGLPGQERMDVHPRQLRAQVRLLRLCGWRPLSFDQLTAFHDGRLATLPRRSYVLTADDGFRDAVREVTQYSAAHPQIFAVTSEVGGVARWLGDAQLADWAELRDAARSGATVGSHARHHVRLDELSTGSATTELNTSLDDLRAQLGHPLPVIAYPHGAHNRTVRELARDAGYALAWTTRQGLNGAGTDPWCLRRVEPKIWDSSASYLWKVVTGESPPRRWEWRLVSRFRRMRGEIPARGTPRQRTLVDRREAGKRR